MKIHMVRGMVAFYWDRTYCGLDFDCSDPCLTHDPRKTTCGTCRRAQRRDWCERCGRPLVGWDAEDVCRCEGGEEVAT